jgi:hypothetical protein
VKPEAGFMPFLDLRELDAAVPGTADPDCFLGRFSPTALRRELEGAQVLSALLARGYADVVARTEVQGDEHRLCLLSSDGRHVLVDLRLSESTCVSTEPGLQKQGADVLYLLAVRWLMLQDPRAAFTPERPVLPGQTHPGLHLGRRVYGRLMAWATDWGKDGLLGFPAYFHNAVFCSSLFRFLSPVRQGRLEALQRDLATLPIAEASAAVAKGRVVEEPGGGVLSWEAGEMVSPITRHLKAYLDSPEYATAVKKTRDATRFRLQ